MAENMKYLAQEIKELTLGTPPWHRGEYKIKKGFFKDSHIITVETAKQDVQIPIYNNYR